MIIHGNEKMRKANYFQYGQSCIQQSKQFDEILNTKMNFVDLIALEIIFLNKETFFLSLEAKHPIP